jgi:hypothetical protein
VREATAHSASQDGNKGIKKVIKIKDTAQARQNAALSFFKPAFKNYTFLRSGRPVK